MIHGDTTFEYIRDTASKVVSPQKTSAAIFTSILQPQPKSRQVPSQVSGSAFPQEMGRPATPCKLGAKRVRSVRCRGGNMKYRALRLDAGNYAWGSVPCRVGPSDPRDLGGDGA